MDPRTQESDPTFSYDRFDDAVHVIGIGGIGGHVVRTLGKGGFRAPLHIWDADTVAPHNSRNQPYEPSLVGLTKTRALEEKLHQWGAPAPIVHNQFIRGPTALSGIVFLCIDDMDERWNIWTTCIKGNQEIPLFIETRMDGISFIIHTLDPKDEYHQHQWEQNWYPSSRMNNQGAGCGGPLAALPTAEIVASFAVWQLMHYEAIKGGEGDELFHQIRGWTRPPKIDTYKWEL